MANAVWQKALGSCADPERAGQYLDRLALTKAKQLLDRASGDQARIVTALLTGSQSLSERLIAHPDWIETLLDLDNIGWPRRLAGLERDIQSWLPSLLKTANYAGAFAKLRLFKQREMLRIAARDLARLGNIAEIIGEISDVADACLQTVYEICHRQLVTRLGMPHHLNADGRWQPTEFCILGMGKLGGRELNYSSDVDVLFIYEDEGSVFKTSPRKDQSPGRTISNHQFFRRLGEAFIAELSSLTSEGELFRIDLRLRPEGEAGPLARSLSSYEDFYAQWGQTWERMMLIKARRVAGSSALASEFLEMIQPFRYPRSLSERILQEISEMKQRIEKEVVKAGEMERNVKLGRGGIREIEFVVQTLQVLHAGREPFLQDSQTLSALQKLVRYKILPPGNAEALSKAYCFLREVEHRVQMENNLQTHTIPNDANGQKRIAALMGFKSYDEFEIARASQCESVRRIYSGLLQADKPRRDNSLPDFERGEGAWHTLLQGHHFKDSERAYRTLREFVQGPGYVHVSSRTSELAMELVPALLSLCQGRPSTGSKTETNFVRLSDPDRVLVRLDSFISAYGSRAMLYETWIHNPSLFELLLMLFDRSEFLAEIAIRTPDLVDELVLSGRLRRRKSSSEILGDLRHGFADNDQFGWIRRYYQAELMRLGLRDIVGLVDFESNLTELSTLAEVCLQYALEVVLREKKIKGAPLAIIGLGKLGGAELNYGSDLDILFVASSAKGSLLKLQRLATDVIDLLSKPTEMGATFPIDIRLRPDGDKGLIVNTLPAYEDYYRSRAQFWEIQALSRSRAIAGHVGVGKQFEELAARLTNFRQPSQPMSAFTPDWRAELIRMRQRIEMERTPLGKDGLAIKTGQGGLIDAEFIAQASCLANGWHEPNTLRALQRARELGILSKGDGNCLIENYRKLRRVEGILRRWSFAAETLLPDDPEPLYRVAIRCGFKNTDAFLGTVATWRRAIRGVYSKVMSGR